MNVKTDKPGAKVYRLARRPVTDESVPTGSLASLTGLREEMARVYGDMRANRISILSGKRMIGALEQMARLIEAIESSRLAAIERGRAAKDLNHMSIEEVDERLRVLLAKAFRDEADLRDYVYPAMPPAWPIAN